VAKVNVMGIFMNGRVDEGVVVGKIAVVNDNLGGFGLVKALTFLLDLPDKTTVKGL